MINEGDINRCERKYREFVNMCKNYDPNINMKEVWVKRTIKNNWAVYVGLKKMFITSFSCLDDDVIKKNNIKLVKEDIDETYKDKLHKYTITYLQYDPDVQKEYEDGDVDDDELHDSAIESDVVKPLDIAATDDEQAKRKAKKIIGKEINKHPELCGACVSRDGEEIDTIFI